MVRLTRRSEVNPRAGEIRGLWETRRGRGLTSIPRGWRTFFPRSLIVDRVVPKYRKCIIRLMKGRKFRSKGAATRAFRVSARACIATGGRAVGVKIKRKRRQRS